MPKFAALKVSKEQFMENITGYNEKNELATFASGCFWNVQESFGNLRGVIKTTVGYTGGHTENPTYEAVCSDKTGHAEVVQIEYNPAVISYRKLLQIFWQNHDPTTLNRQGPDTGSQYRSAIFYHTLEQKRSADISMKNLKKSGKYGGKSIVTDIKPAEAFYPAEEYHQKYLKKRGVGTCKV